MRTEYIVRRLSHSQRAALIDHVCGPQPIDYTIKPRGQDHRRIIHSLVGQDLIRRCGGMSTARRPTMTQITDFGREVAAAVLAGYADALVRAGCLDDVRGLKMTPAKLRDARLMMASTAALTESLRPPAKTVPETETADAAPNTSKPEPK